MSSEKSSEVGVELDQYPGYLIERDGKVFSIKSKRYLKASIQKSTGNYTVSVINREKKRRATPVGKLVVLAYGKPLGKKMSIRYKDGDNSNHDVSNIEVISWGESQSKRYGQPMLQLDVDKKLVKRHLGRNIASRTIKQELNLSKPAEWIKNDLYNAAPNGTMAYGYYWKDEGAKDYPQIKPTTSVSDTGYFRWDNGELV